MKNPKVLILFIDAFRFDYLKKMPLLKKTLKQATYGETTTELGYASRMGAFFTGKSPQQHGLFTVLYATKNSDFKWIRILIPVIKTLSKFIKPLGPPLRYATFALLNLISFLKGNHYFFYLKSAPLEMLPFLDISIKKHYCEKGAFPVASIFDTFRKKNLKFHFYMWPFYLTNTKVRVELPFSKTNNDQHRNNKFKKILDQNGDIFFAQFFNLDTAGHLHGVNSMKLLKEIKFTDKLINNLKKKFLSKHPDGKILIWTDHGMTPIKKSLDVQKILDDTGLKPTKDYLYFIDAALLRVWPQTKKSEKIILQTLRKTELIEITKSLKNKYQINYPDEKYGRIIFQAKAGTLLFPNFFDGQGAPKAMHGYFPETKSEKGTYVYIDPQHSGKRTDIKTRDLYQLVLDSIKTP